MLKWPPVPRRSPRVLRRRALPQHLLKFYLHSLCATFNTPHLPEIRSGRHLVTVIQPDCVLIAHRTAYPTTITPLLVDGNLYGRSAVDNSAELTDTHALPATITRIGVNFCNVFGPKHHRNRMCYRAAHSQAVRTVAVAQSPDERRVKSPNSMAQTFLFVISKGRYCFFLAQYLQSGHIRTRKKALIEAPHDLG